MTSNFQNSSTRNDAHKNFRGDSSDKRKCKSCSPNDAREQPDFPQSPNGHGQNIRTFPKSNSFHNSYSKQTPYKDFYGNRSPLKINNALHNNKSFDRPQNVCSLPPANRTPETIYKGRHNGHIVEQYEGQACGVSIKPPWPAEVNLEMKPEQSYKEFVNSRDHDIGSGRYLRGIDSLPPRFQRLIREKNQVAENIIDLAKSGDYESIIEIMKNFEARGDHHGNVGFKKPPAAPSNQMQQIGPNLKDPFQNYNENKPCTIVIPPPCPPKAIPPLCPPKAIFEKTAVPMVNMISVQLPKYPNQSFPPRNDFQRGSMRDNYVANSKQEGPKQFHHKNFHSETTHLHAPSESQNLCGEDRTFDTRPPVHKSNNSAHSQDVSDRGSSEAAHKQNSYFKGGYKNVMKGSQMSDQSCNQVKEIQPPLPKSNVSKGSDMGGSEATHKQNYDSRAGYKSTTKVTRIPDQSGNQMNETQPPVHKLNTSLGSDRGGSTATYKRNSDSKGGYKSNTKENQMSDRSGNQMKETQPPVHKLNTSLGSDRGGSEAAYKRNSDSKGGYKSNTKENQMSDRSGNQMKDTQPPLERSNASGGSEAPPNQNSDSRGGYKSVTKNSQMSDHLMRETRDHEVKDTSSNHKSSTSPKKQNVLCSTSPVKIRTTNTSDRAHSIQEPHSREPHFTNSNHLSHESVIQKQREEMKPLLNVIINRSRQSSCSSDDLASISSELSTNSVKNCRGFCVKIKVSARIDDLNYWQNFLKNSINSSQFTVQIASEVTQMLSVIFPNKSDAQVANRKLRKIEWKDDGNPFIQKVRVPKAFYNEKSNVNLKTILQDCLRDIDKLCARALIDHENKMNRMQAEFDALKRNNDEVSLLVVQKKMDELEQIQEVFLRFTLLKKKQMENSSNYESVKRHKRDFAREYMSFKGCLPIYAKKEEILDLVTQNQVSILMAETGSGKSTQLVQYLLQNGFGEKGVIICTQPRKIAAVSIARYISGQIGSPVGSVVGYEVGLDKKHGRDSKIIYMTDYSLLKMCVDNNNLNGISCIVIDEAHERSLFTDLLLGIIKRCLPSRPDLRVIITSATIDPAVFQDFFRLSEKSLLSVPGRTYPVRVVWEEQDSYVGQNYVENSVNLVYKIHKENGPGDVLVFLTSPLETDEAVHLFKTYQNPPNGLRPLLFSLHGKLNISDQLKVFSPTPKKCRKIIFATNSAETSVTIPGIKFVVDSGMVKEKQYIANKNRNALVVGFISKSSAEQRKGRAGRTQPGICFRMYSEKNYAKMPVSVTPEILRVNLQLALLKILEFKIQPEEFNFVEAPAKESIIFALHSLEFLGAVKDKCFTPLGKKICKLQLEPQLGKLVILGAEEGVGYETSAIAAIATVSGMVFYRNEDNKKAADQKKITFCKEEGDFHTFLNVFKKWQFIPREYKNQWCADNYINAKAMRIASDAVEELIRTLRTELNIIIKKTFKPTLFEPKCERILFDCFAENVCIFSGHRKTGYLTPFEPGSFFVHPSSSLAYLDMKFHNFIIYSTVLKTSRTFLLNVTPIEESTIISAYKAGSFPFQIDMLQKLQSSPARIYPIGESVLIREILGRQGYKLREIEQQLQAFTKTDAFHIEVNVEKGEILVHIDQQHHFFVKKSINSVVQEAVCHMNKEEDIFRIADCASSCFALGSGAIVNDILLPGEFREVIVEGYSRSLSVKEVVSKLKEFGDLQSFQETEEHGRPMILGTYVKASDAQNAIDQLQKDNLFKISCKVSYAKLSDKSVPLFRLQVTWPRSPCLGSGWITFETMMDCLEASGLLTNESFYISDRYILFTPVKNSEKDLQMKNLPPYVQSEDIIRAAKVRLPDYIKVANVNLVRSKSYKASESEINSLKKELLQLFSKFTPSSKLVINLKNPSSSDVSWTALVYFEVFEDCERALKELKDNAKIGNQNLHIKPVLKSSQHCSYQIFKIVEKHLGVLMRVSKEKGICTEFDIKPGATDKRVLITFACSDIDKLNKVHKQVRKLIHGFTYPFSDPATLLCLFSPNSQEHLKGIQRSTQTIINANFFRKSITIYGLEKGIADAQSLISGYVSSSIVKEGKTRVFNLCGRKIPLGFLRALRQKFGFRLTGLIEKFNLTSADIDFVNRKLIVRCSEKTMEQVERCLGRLCVEVKKASEKNASSSHESCPVCLDLITSDLFRLNHCGHAFCKQCLLLQLESKIIPLVCVHKDCEKPIFVEDIRKLLLSNDDLKREFTQAALKNFVSKSNSVRYCPTPDCSMVYRATPQGAEFECPACENTICTRCHDFYHHGMTCDMFLKTKKDADYPLKIWIQRDPENRKLCPKCSAPIEKNEGCNHVLCTHCETHLCWLCLRTFSRGEDVYDHMPYCDFAS